MSIMIQTMQYALFPAITVLVGGLAAYIKTPSKKFSSFTQHMAAGIVFAAVALELLPKLSEFKALIPMPIGFSLGVIAMLLVKHLSGGHGHSHEHETPQPTIPWSTLIAVAIDLFIDGLLIGIAFVAGEKGGLLVSIALGIEILFLGLAISASFKQRKIALVRNLFMQIILAVLVLLGAFIGASVISTVGSNTLEAVLAFGVAALLYLVTEELLEEAHETEDTPLITASFFAGFLLIYLLNHMI